MSGRPQRIVVPGRGTVFVVDVAEYDKLRVRAEAPNLHELLSGSPLSQLDFERDGVCSPVRDVRLCEQEEVRDEP